MYGTPTYRSWATMKRRCNNKNDVSYKYYGEIGIGYQNSWEDFRNFLSDMGERPEGKTLDRIDYKKGYSKLNCKWSSPSDQSRNQRIKGTSSKYRGVAKTANGAFSAQIQVNYKNYYLGTFKTELEAAIAYQNRCYELLVYKLSLT